MPTDTDARIAVRKTYKLFVGGAFPRSESGRSYPVHSATGALLAHAAGDAYTAAPTVKPMCKCTEHGHDAVRAAIREQGLKTAPAVRAALGWKNADGCASCRPAPWPRPRGRWGC